MRRRSLLIPLSALLLALAACSGGADSPSPTAPLVAPPAPNVGSPTARPSATVPIVTPRVAVATPGTPPVPATVASPAQPAAATATRATPATPAGNIPAGWRVYQGDLPFTIAYPPDWSVDETQQGQGLITFYAPLADRSVFLIIATTGRAQGDANLDVLRDQWFRARTTACQRFAIEETRQERFAGTEFATVGATCDLPGRLLYSYTGIGAMRQVPWIFELDAPYDLYDTARRGTFLPMLASWTFTGDGR